MLLGFARLRAEQARGHQPQVGQANLFSFNDPQGMCPECNGMGKKLVAHTDKFVDWNKSLKEGALQVPGFAAWEKDMYANSGFFDIDKKRAPDT